MRGLPYSPFAASLKQSKSNHLTHKQICSMAFHKSPYTHTETRVTLANHSQNAIIPSMTRLFEPPNPHAAGAALPLCLAATYSCLRRIACSCGHNRAQTDENIGRTGKICLDRMVMNLVNEGARMRQRVGTKLARNWDADAAMTAASHENALRFKILPLSLVKAGLL